MIGLRKVVKLKIYDMPKGLAQINKNNNTYQFYWKNKYYIGNTELFKSRRFDNMVKKPLFKDKCTDNYLDKMISFISSNDKNPDENMITDKEFLFYAGGDSSIYYFGKDLDNIKKKIKKN